MASSSTYSSVSGVVQRPSASTALWAHLLRKDVSALAPNSSATPSSNISIAPIDKNGTSMRLLLLDTSHNLEKFSSRVDKLTVGVDETKAEVVAVHKLFQDEHEKLTHDIVDIVNRCQTEIQKSIGTPAQANKLEDLHKDLSYTDRRIEALDKRIDLLHTLHQTQTETLQLQAQAIQSQFQALQDIQNQQGNILSALSPLLPLLQAVPLQIETSRSSITDTLLRVRPFTDNPGSVKTPSLVRMSSPEPQAGNRSSSTLRSGGPQLDTTCLSPRKRPRLELEHDEIRAGNPLRLRDAAKTKADGSPVVLSRRTSVLASNRSRYPAQLNRHASAQDNSPPSYRFRTPFPTISPSVTHRDQGLIKTPSGAPRRPLGDLLLSARNSTSSFATKDRAQSSAPSGETFNDPASYSRQPTSLSLLAVPSPPECLPRIVQNHDSNSGSAASSIFRHPQQLPANASLGKPVPLQQNIQVNAPATPKPTVLTTHFDFDSRIESSRVSSDLLKPGDTPRDRNPVHTQVSPRSGFTRVTSRRRPEEPNHPLRLPFTDNADLDVLLNNPPKLPAVVSKPMSIKDRKAHGLLAQVTSRNERKRFIPLDDDDEDEDLT